MSAPDLQAVLATLAQFSQAQAPSQTSSSQTAQGEQSRLQLYANASQPAKATIDPATITTSQEGLRCVTKIAAQNRSFEESIRKMMRDQRAHEMRWYAERQKLKQTQANRNKSSAEALSILQSLGNAAGSTTDTSQDQPGLEAELAAFDMGIYLAQQDMQAAMTLELKALGVPFFGTIATLIRGEEDSSETTAAQPRYSQPVTAVELLQLQRRMIRHLEDLYRD